MRHGFVKKKGKTEIKIKTEMRDRGVCERGSVIVVVKGKGNVLPLLLLPLARI